MYFGGQTTESHGWKSTLYAHCVVHHWCQLSDLVCTPFAGEDCEINRLLVRMDSCWKEDSRNSSVTLFTAIFFNMAPMCFGASAKQCTNWWCQANHKWSGLTEPAATALHKYITRVTDGKWYNVQLSSEAVYGAMLWKFHSFRYSSFIHNSTHCVCLM